MLTNMTAIEESVNRNSEVMSGVFPRWISLGSVSNPNPNLS